VVSAHGIFPLLIASLISVNLSSLASLLFWSWANLIDLRGPIIADFRSVQRKSILNPFAQEAIEDVDWQSLNEQNLQLEG